MKRILTDDDLDLPRVEALADQLGWTRIDTEAPPEDSHIKGVWRTDKAGTHVALVDDPIAGFSYLLLGSPTDSPATEEALREKLHLIDVDRVLELGATARDPEAHRKARVLAGLLAHGPFEADLFTALVASLADQDENIQESTIDALAYTTWPQFEAAIRGYIDEPWAPSRLKEKAELLLKSHQASNWNAGFESSPVA